MQTPYIDIHTHRAASGSAITLRSHRLGVGETLPPLPYSAGIHPWDVASVGDSLERTLNELRAMPAAAIGEIGLDYAIETDHGRQKEVFVRQLEIAAERRLPVIIHCVRAFEDVMSALSRYDLAGAIMHGYTGSRQQTERAVRQGVYLSLGPVSFRSGRTVESLPYVPSERIFLETDDSGLPIEEIYTTAQKLTGIPEAELKKCIYDNYLKLFGAG